MSNINNVNLLKTLPTATKQLFYGFEKSLLEDFMTFIPIRGETQLV